MKFCSIILLLLAPFFLMADHLVGGDIQYKYIGDSTGIPFEYEITLRLYRDVDGIPLGVGPQYVNICSSCYSTSAVALDLVEGGPGVYAPTLFDCVSQSAISTVQMEYYVYSGTVVLPGKCKDFRFTFESCCRNASIVNIANPNQSGLLLKSKLNNAVGHNSSPQFLSEPVRAFCVGNQFLWQHYAEEKDGDSLYYTLAPVKSFTGVCNELDLAYTQGFKYNQPISVSPNKPLTLDHTTGLMSFTPTKTEIAVLALEVEEFRFNSELNQWELIGSSFRDIQITISPKCKPSVQSGVYLDSNFVFYSSNDELPYKKGHCKDTVVEVNLGVNVIGSSISKDGSEFKVASVNGDPVVVKKVDFAEDFNGETKVITITLATPLHKNSLYNVALEEGSDGNTLINKCGFSISKGNLFKIDVSDCIPLNFVIDNVSVIKDQWIKLDWNIDYTNIDLADFKEYRIYRRTLNGNWDLISIEKDIFEKTFLDQSLTPFEVDHFIYQYKIMLFDKYGMLASADPRNTVLLKATRSQCDSLYLKWNSYKSRYAGFLVDVGSFATGNLVWSTLPNNFYPNISTIDTTYFIKLPFSDYGKYKLRVRAIENGTNFISESNWLECTCIKQSNYSANQLLVPNVFTPNSDGVNDAFFIPGIEFFPDNDFMVFNRWGNIVYSAKNYNNDLAWTGLNNSGTKLSNGVYLFVLTLYPEGEQAVQKTGSITILSTQQ